MGTPVALDTSLAILLVVGATSREYIRVHKRLRQYRDEDFDILDTAIGLSSGIVWTPHVLTEASNFLAHFEGSRRDDVYAVLRRLIEEWPEADVGSREASQRAECLRLGLTDASLLALAERGATIVTSDGRLQAEALAGGLRCVHFEELRSDLRDPI